MTSNAMIGLLLGGLLLILLFGALGLTISPLFFILLVLILVVVAASGYYGHRHS